MPSAISIIWVSPQHRKLPNTKNHVCGQFRRELIPGSLQVFPIKDYGAIEQGKQTS